MEELRVDGEGGVGEGRGDGRIRGRGVWLAQKFSRNDSNQNR